MGITVKIGGAHHLVDRWAEAEEETAAAEADAEADREEDAEDAFTAIRDALSALTPGQQMDLAEVVTNAGATWDKLEEPHREVFRTIADYLFTLQEDDGGEAARDAEEAEDDAASAP